MLTNFSDEELILPRATDLGVAEKISESLVDLVNAKVEANSTELSKPPRKKKKEALYNKLLKGKLDHLNPEDRKHT
jgi:hypothetical protein